MGIGTFFEEGLAVLRRQWALLLGFWAARTGVALVPGLLVWAGLGHAGGVSAVGFVAPLASFAIYVALIRMLLVREGLANMNVAPRYGAVILVVIVVFVLSGLASVLFIVPGIMLGLRWYLASYYTLARGLGVSEAMAASRDATTGHRWTLFLTILVLGLILLIPYSVFFFGFFGVADFLRMSQSLAAGVFTPMWLGIVACGLVADLVGRSLDVAIFAVLAGREDGVAEVFARHLA